MQGKIAFWGVGQVAEFVLNYCHDIEPDFFLDTYSEKTMYHGKKVYQPKNYDKWNELTVIITTLQEEEISCFLEEKGLKKGKSYFGISEIWEFGNYDDVVNQIQKFLYNKKDNKPITIFVKNKGKRVIDNTDLFYNAFKTKYEQECSLDFDIYWKGPRYREDNADISNIVLPSMFYWDGYKITKDLEKSIGEKDWFSLLDPIEQKYVLQLEESRCSRDRTLAIKVSAYNYVKLKEVVDLLGPQKMVLWTDSIRGCCILADIAKKRNIPCVYLEFGWLPGTIQVDKRGIGGRSEFVSGHSKLKEISKEKLEEYNISKIINDIVANKRDTGTFKITETDNAVFNSLNPGKKYIFFPGLGDRNPVFNCKSDLWKKEISALFESSHDALVYLAKVCKENDWQILYKPHPGFPSDYDVLVDGYKDVIFEVRDMEIDQIISRCDAVVVCFHSAIEFKTLMNKKPLINLGYSMMSVAECSYKVKDRVDIACCVRKALDEGVTETQEKNFEIFVAQLLETCLWDDQIDRNLRYGLDIKNKDFWE